ncbi:unnamed protein product [Lathyrus oleraceus]
MAEGLVLRGTMRSHTDMVTAIATPIDNSDMIVTASRVSPVTLTLFRMLSSHPTVSLLYLVHGMVNSAFGISTPEPLPADSSVTPRMFYLWLSRLTTVRLCLLLVTTRLSCGTLSVSASTLSRTVMIILIGLVVFVSALAIIATGNYNNNTKSASPSSSTHR